MLVVIAGGGTGGHIYPALAIAKALVNLGHQVEFIGAKGGLEERIVPRENFPLYLVSIGKLNFGGGWWTKLKTLLGVPIALYQSRSLLLRRRPQVVLGVGGYASGPVTLIASWMGISTFIWEPNAMPGLTNRLLSYFVKTAIVVFSEAQNHLHSKKILVLGMPIRDIIERVGLTKSLEVVSLKKVRPLRLLVFGGSQGAQFLNRVVQGAVLNHQRDWESVELVHQTGIRDYSYVSSAYATAKVGPHVHCVEYLHDIAKNFEWADLVVCRSGASTVAEVAACGLASILVPLPSAADDHQKKNALSLANRRACIMIEQKDLSEAVLLKQIQYFNAHRDELKIMGNLARALHIPNAAHAIAKLLEA